MPLRCPPCKGFLSFFSKVVVSKYRVRKLSNMNWDDFDELVPHLTKHQRHLKLWVLIPTAYINSDMLLYMKLKCWAKLNIEVYSETRWVDLVTLLGRTMW